MSLSKRAIAGLAELRDERSQQVSDRGLVVERRGDDVWWWTFAGTRANLTLRANLPSVVEPAQASSPERIRLRRGVAPGEVGRALEAIDPGCLAMPAVDRAAIAGLKFAEVLPSDVATAVIGARLIESRVTLALTETGLLWL